jgi:predicted ester cyclase
MPENENKRIIQRYIEEVVNTGNVERLSEFIGPGYTVIHNNVRHEQGLDGAKEHILGFRETFHDLYITINRQIAEGDWVATQITARGIHKGVWMGMKPTGKTVEITCVNVDKIVDGKIVEHGGAADMLEPLMAIDAVRVVGLND